MKTKNILLAYAAVILACLSACAGPIELTMSTQDVSAGMGSAADLQATVKNTQTVDEDVKVFVAGTVGPWTIISPDSLRIAAGTEATVNIRIDPTMSTPSGASTLTVTASSADTERWDSKTLKVNVAPETSGASGVHQLATLSVKPNSRFHINLYYDPKIYNDDGYNLKDGDDCCVGDTFRMQATGSGDFWGDGGACDSPPVVMVESLAQTIQEIDSSLYHPDTDKVPFCDYLARCDFCCPGCRGRSGCLCQCGGLNLGTVDCTCIRDVAVFCESKCKNTPTGSVSSIGSNFKVTGDGRVDVDLECVTSCAIYDKDTGKYEYISLSKQGDPWFSPDAGATTAEVSESFFLNAVTDKRAPDVVVVSYSYTHSGGKTTVKADLQNKGDVMAYLDNVTLNIPDYRILYAPATINPGETTEILFETSAQNITGLRTEMKYTSEKTGCLKTKKFSGLFYVGACKTNSECDDGKSETDDYCNNPGTADSYCTNTKYAIILATASTQTYGLEVSGDCSNKYYSCYTPNREGKFIVGEQCYNAIDKYRTDASGRFAVKYDLSKLEKGLSISAVRLYLAADEVMDPQDIAVYSAENNWEGANCVPGGDICTQPYCPECAPTQNFAGKSLSSTHVDAGGNYFLDVTEYVKEKYNSGEQYVTLQVRGAETPGACGQQGIWTRHDIAFNAEASAPYLKILE